MARGRTKGTFKKYTAEYLDDALQMVYSGKSMSQVAKDLGVHRQALHRAFKLQGKLPRKVL
jgi:DNA-binding phage protein